MLIIQSVRIKHVLVLMLSSKVYLTFADPEICVKSCATLITFYGVFLLIFFFIFKRFLS